MVPDTGKSRVAVRHAHVAFFQQDLARFFAYQNAEIDPSSILREIERIQKLHDAKPAYSEGPTVDVVFKSILDRCAHV